MSLETIYDAVLKGKAKVVVSETFPLREAARAGLVVRVDSAYRFLHDRIQAKVLYKLHNRFPAAGRYSMRLEQAMRMEPLPAVMDVGVSVERSVQ